MPKTAETDPEAGKTVTQAEVDAVSYSSLFAACAEWATNPQRIVFTILRLILITCLLWMFLFFLDLMGTSFKVLGSCAGGDLFSDLENPIAGLMVGVLATVFVQSSSTSTSIVVSLVGAGTMPVKTAIPVIMGANIGTSVTNTIVSMAYVNSGDNFERAFAGATVHDMFNMCTVAVLLPIELITGLLENFSETVMPSDVPDGDKWKGPLKKIVSPLTAELIIANKDIMKNVAKGKATCKEVYATHEEGFTGDYMKGLIKSTSSMKSIYKKGDGEEGEYEVIPLFYDKYATQDEDIASASATLAIAIIGLCTCMYCLVKVLSYITRNSNQAMLKKAASMDPYIAIGVGTGITLLVQSSSITTSVLTPLAASDIISLEQMLPLTLGANIGTTATGILASLVSSKPEAVQIAICHLSFNCIGILLWFGPPIPCPSEGGRGICCLSNFDYFWPVPFPYKKADGKQLQMKDVPLNFARFLGGMTRVWQTFPLYYILFMFVVLPGILFGVSTLYAGSPAFQALGVMATTVLILIILRLAFWLIKQDGFTKVSEGLASRQQRINFNKQLMKTIPDLEARVALLEKSMKK
jgi:sodium-dependent phosphate cotransporter